MNKKRQTAKMKWCALLGALLITSSTVSASEWGYDPGDVMPEDWGTIEGSEICGSGYKQSPIDLSQSKLTPKRSRAKVKNLPDLVFDYHASPLNVVNNGHTVEFEYEPGSLLKLKKDGPAYEVLQFHFHAPAEHSFEMGALYEMEMHIVHRSLSDPEKLAVIGVMIKEGDRNSTLAPIWDNAVNLMSEGDHVTDPEQSINIFNALPDDTRYFSYNGSLTTPPCYEIVNWKVLREPIEMSRDQIHAFVTILDNSCCAKNGNNRPTHNLNGRRIYLDASKRDCTK